MKWTCIKCDKEISQYREYCDDCDDCESKQFRKIGGFLYLPLIGLFIGAFGWIMLLTEAIKTMFIIDFSSVYRTKLLGYLCFEFAFQLIFLFFSIYLISIFFRKKRTLPKLYIYFSLSVLVYMFLDLIFGMNAFPDLVRFEYDTVKPIVRNIIAALIWIPYFITSVRVKKTFIH